MKRVSKSTVQGRTPRGFGYTTLLDINMSEISVQLSSGLSALMWIGRSDAAITHELRPEFNIQDEYEHMVISSRIHATRQNAQSILNYLVRYVGESGTIEPHRETGGYGETLVFTPLEDGMLHVDVEGDITTLLSVGYPWRKLSDVESEHLWLDTHLLLDKGMSENMARTIFYGLENW